VLEIAQLTGADTRTVSKWLDSRPVKSFSDWAFRHACKQLGIEADVAAVRGGEIRDHS